MDDQEKDFRYGPQDKGFDIDSCRDECRDYPYFALQDNGFCSCDYTYGTPSNVYQQTEDAECNANGLGGVLRNAVYINNLYATEFTHLWTPSDSNYYALGNVGQ